jgi:hypothetical protein
MKKCCTCESKNTFVKIIYLYTNLLLEKGKRNKRLPLGGKAFFFQDYSSIGIIASLFFSSLKPDTIEMILKSIVLR